MTSHCHDCTDWTSYPGKQRVEVGQAKRAGCIALTQRVGEQERGKRSGRSHQDVPASSVFSCKKPAHPSMLALALHAGIIKYFWMPLNISCPGHRMDICIDITLFSIVFDELDSTSSAPCLINSPRSDQRENYEDAAALGGSRYTPLPS